MELAEISTLLKRLWLPKKTAQAKCDVNTVEQNVKPSQKVLALLPGLGDLVLDVLVLDVLVPMSLRRS